MKLIALALGLVLGFGGGIWVGVHNPELASSLNKKQEDLILKGKLEATEAFNQKLDHILNNKSGAPSATPGAGFLSGNALGGTGDATDDLRKLRDDEQKALQDIKGQLAQKK